MATDPDDIAPAQLVSAETMQKWTDSIRELQGLVPGAAAAAFADGPQDVASSWRALVMAGAYYEGVGVDVGPSGIGVAHTGYYQVAGQIRFFTDDGTPNTARGIGITNSPSNPPPASRTAYPTWLQSIHRDAGTPWHHISGELRLAAGDIVTLWSFHGAPVPLTIAYRSLSVRRVG